MTRIKTASIKLNDALLRLKADPVARVRLVEVVQPMSALRGGVQPIAMLERNIILKLIYQ